MSNAQKVSTCLWFDTQAEEAAALYVSLLEGSRITGTMRYGKGAPMPEGTAMTVHFELAGTPFTALNGGPVFKFSEASSMVVRCDDQAEIDRLWDALTANGGQASRCGWLKDRYGLSWQIIPAQLPALLGGDAATASRAMTAMMTMGKLDIAKLEAARAA
jgi:predicted 3-demethylubiquinone-9 3-methyltransferase (glyoxalase superfamily)